MILIFFIYLCNYFKLIYLNWGFWWYNINDFIVIFLGLLGGLLA